MPDKTMINASLKSNTASLLATVVTMLLLLAVVTDARAETEPNDSFGSENPVTVNSITTGDSAGGSSDYFKIDNPERFTRITITLTTTTENPGADQVSYRILDGGFEDVLEEMLGSASPPVETTITPSTETFSQLPINMSSFILVLDFASEPVGNVTYEIAVTGKLKAETLAKISKLERQIKKTKNAIRKAKKQGARGKKKVKSLKKLLRKQQKELRRLQAQ